MFYISLILKREMIHERTKREQEKKKKERKRNEMKKQGREVRDKEECHVCPKKKRFKYLFSIENK